jgi:hypothetical protein
MKDTRYCTNCQTLRPADYGKMIKAGPTMRWRCTACAERTNTPRYKSKATK